MALARSFLGIVALALGLQLIPSYSLTSQTQQARSKECTDEDKTIYQYCKGNAIYAVDSCFNERLEEECIEARCYRGRCVDEAYASTRQQECEGSVDMWWYCKGNSVYAIDDCGNHVLIKDCSQGARCFQGNCEDEVDKK